MTATASVVMLVSVCVVVGLIVPVLVLLRVAVSMAAAASVVVLVSVGVVMGMLMLVSIGVAMCVPTSSPFTVDLAVIVRMGMLALLDNGDIRVVSMPAAPVGVRVAMHMRVRLMIDMTMFMVVRILQNPLRVGVSARFTGFVTVRFGVAGVRHGGFLARFVV